MKRFLILACVLGAAACAQAPEEVGCPMINIPDETSKVFSGNGRANDFQIKLVGVDRYCYTEPTSNRRYAVVTPLFKVRRLRESSRSVFDVASYLKTSPAAPDYMGTYTANQTFSMPAGQTEVTLRGKPTSARIPMPPYGNFYLDTGLVLSAAEMNANKKMYDIDYKYITQKELEAAAAPQIKNVYLEVGADEEIIYSETENKPVVVKKNRPKNNCQN